MSTAVAQDSTDFFAAYDAMLERWQVPVTARTVPTAFGVTRVNVCGPEDAPPLVLIHGGRTSSPYWFANARALSREHRVYALDTLGDPGRSVNTGKPLRNRADLADWLDQSVDGLDLAAADFCGHSFGAWQALTYAMRRPARVRRLVLLDPSQCFAGFTAACLWHAALAFRPGGSMAKYFAWEAGGAPLDEGWLALQAAAANVPTARIISARKPSREQFAALTSPTLVLLAERSRVHDLAKVRAGIGRALPDGRVSVGTLPGVSHHMVPFEHSDELNRRIAEFLAPSARLG